ncbi:uncharacterized protein LOC144884771 [Branchiostoma floridae x Branchiostoma japonicum]
MCKKWTSSPAYWLALSSGLLTVGVILLITAAVLAANLQHGGGDSYDFKDKAKGTTVFGANLNESGAPLLMAPYTENNLAVVYSTTPSTRPESPSTGPLTATSGITESLPTTVMSLSTMTTDIDECVGNPCQHGTCVDRDGGHTCTCFPGWTGLQCQRASKPNTFLSVPSCPNHAPKKIWKL